MYRMRKNVLPGSTAQTIRDIKVNFIPNESPSKTGCRSISGHS